MHDEKYINNRYLRDLAREFHSNIQFQSIDLRTIIAVLKIIRRTLNQIIFIKSGQINGELKTARALLTLDASSDLASIPTILPRAMTGLILGCIQQDADKIKHYFIENKAPLPDETLLESRQAYLSLISEATLQLIKEIAMTLGVLRNPQQSIATSLKPPGASILKKQPQDDPDHTQGDQPPSPFTSR